MIKLVTITRTNPLITKWMQIHYSQPKGFVGRNICYCVFWNEIPLGAIVGGSATKFLPGRDTVIPKDTPLNNIVNNIFYHIEPINKYPVRNFTTKVLKEWRKKIQWDWYSYYRDFVKGFESLVELPRIGELYKRDGWSEVGITKGYTCKRTGGVGTDSWTGKRIWDTVNLRPKRVFVRLP